MQKCLCVLSGMVAGIVIGIVFTEFYASYAGYVLGSVFLLVLLLGSVWHLRFSVKPMSTRSRSFRSTSRRSVRSKRRTPAVR